MGNADPRRFSRRFSRIGAFIGVASVMVAAVIITYVRVTDATGGEFIYSLDDPYIHLAIAKNLVEHGTYGINPGEVAFASSSILWPFLLALGRVLFGSAEMIPLILNVLFSFAVLWVLDRMLQDVDIGGWGRLAAGVFFLFAVPLIPVAFTGIEHVLHIVLVLSMFRILPDVTGSVSDAAKRRLLLVLLVVGVLVRFETLFLAAALIGWFVLRRDFKYAVLILLAVGLPVLINGVIQLAYGGLFLPNSLMMKGHPLNVFSPASWYDAYVSRIIGNLLRGRGYRLLLVLASLLVALLISDRSAQKRWAPAVFVWIVTLLLHILFADAGWFFRYEAYLVASGIAMMGVLFMVSYRAMWRQKSWNVTGILAGITSLLLFLLPLVRIGAMGTMEIPVASSCINEQQVRMGEFLRRHYAGSAIMLNDIGYVSYRGNVRVIDLVGLGRSEIVRVRYDMKFDSTYIRDLARKEHVPVAMIYDSWFKGNRAAPSNWIAAAHWEADRQYVLGGKVVTVYATDSIYLPKLLRALAEE